MGTVANVLVGVATLYLKNPWTASTWTAVGYTKDGVEMGINETVEIIRVPWLKEPVDAEQSAEDLEVSATLMEATLANLLATVPGASLDTDTQTLTFGTDSPVFLGVKLVGTNPAGFDRTITFPKGKPIGSPNVEFRRAAGTGIPFRFLAVQPEGDDVCSIVDSTS